MIAGVQVRLDGLVEQVRVTYAQRQRCLKEIDRVLAALTEREPTAEEPCEHRDVEILLSLPGVGRLITATMLAEAARPLADRDYDTLRTHAGAAPVTKRTGKRCCVVQMRRACNERLRDAAYHWARCSLRQDARSRAYYAQLRRCGHTHGRALRSVVDRWFRILIAMLTHRTLYDPTRFSSCAGTVPVTA